MSGSAYEIAALAMRFWFTALMVFLLWRIIRAVLRDYSAQRTAKKADTGYSLGMLEVVGPELDDRGKIHPLYGRRFALKRENRIGRAASADIRIRHGKIAPYQASIFQKGNRVLLTDFGGKHGVFLNGGRIGEDTPLVDGDEIEIGGVEFVLHLMAAGQGRRPAEEPGRRRRTADAGGPDELFEAQEAETDENWSGEEESGWTRYVPEDDGDGAEYDPGEDEDAEGAYDPEEDGDAEGAYDPEDAPKTRRKRRWRR